MKKIIITLITISTCVLLTAQSPDSGSFFLHKFAQNIGKESYSISRIGDNLIYDIDFKFVDRGSPVPLKAKLVTTAGLEPLNFVIKGSTSRFSEISDSINIRDKRVSLRVGDSIFSQPLQPIEFPVAGYSPGTVQMVLLQYWKKHGRPKSLPLLPSGEVSVSLQGLDTLTFRNSSLILERYVLGGLVWGNELIWTNRNGDLICLITNDAEGDKLEMMEVDHESLLPELLERAANYGMQLFTNGVKNDLAKDEVLMIKGGNIIDVAGSTTLSNYDILIEKGIIKEIAPTGSINIPSGAAMINAKGKTIIPGLWDMHAHFEQAEWGPAYLASGVTTVRDCGNEFVYINAVKHAIDTHRGIGPFIIKAGIIDGPGPLGLGIVRAATKEEAVKAVNLYKDNDFAQIKIYSSISPKILKVICEEAHRLGLSVTGHIPRNMTTRAGIDSGMDQVNHIQYIYAMMKKKPDRSVDLDDTANIAAMNYLRTHHVVIDPTLGVFEMIYRSVNDNILDMEPNYNTLPLPLQSLFINMGMPAEQALKTKPVFQSMSKLVKALYDKGIPIVAGTDMGFPGYSVARELELYVMAGFSPMEAIQSATVIPAQVMNMDKQTSVIRTGRNADLVILNDDPLKDIRNVRKVWKVIREGKVYDPATLRKMAGFKN